MVRSTLAGTVILLKVALTVGLSTAWCADPGPVGPADAPWLRNREGTLARLVVREMEGPPPGIAWPPGVSPPVPPPPLTIEGIGTPARTHVLDVTVANGFTHVTTQFMPAYRVRVTAAHLENLQARPRFARDFPNGIQVAVGDVLRFGQDLGFAGNVCAAGAGRGYWPPGTFCAAAIPTTLTFPNRPVPAAQTCYTTLATVGLFLNGVGLFNWSDAQSYRAENVWHNTATVFEAHSLDICHGHAAEGIYHHHGYSACLAAELGDAGGAHSPLWGFAADGYPIHGPWQADGLLAQSCWRLRNYAAGSATGCGADGQRSCQLVDMADAGKGVRPVAPGPAAGTVELSMFAENPVVTDPGAYYQDHYYDPACTAAGGAALDRHNGHVHAPFVYHYHLTVDADLRPVFPYAFGPTYRGRLHDTAFTTCGPVPFGFPTRNIYDRADIDLGTEATRWVALPPGQVGGGS